MFDIATPATVDFGLVHPLPLDLNQNLYLLAAVRLRDCRQQWLELTAQIPSGSTHDGWSARATGTPLSRRDHALSLYRQHFEAASQLACAEGTISNKQWQGLLERVKPSATANGVHVTQPALERADRSRVALPGALILRLDNELPAIHLLYLPCHAQGLTAFRERADLEQWLIGHCRQQNRQPPLDNLTLVDDTLDQDPLKRGLELLFKSPAPAWADIQNMIAEPSPLPAEVTDSTDAALFGSLSPGTPFSQRSLALSLEQNALDRLLGETLVADPGSALRLKLAQQFDALSQAEQASHTAASALLDSRDAQKMLELRHTENSHYHALHQARIAGLRAEAELQLTLDQLTAEEHQRIIALLDAPDHKLRPADGVVARISLSATQPNLSRNEDLEGVLIIAAAAAFEPGSTDSLLLFWPGLFGGLQRFDSRQALEQSVFRRTPDEQNLAMHLTPLNGDPLVWSLEEQLYQCEQLAVTIIKDNPLPGHAGERASAMEKLREQYLPRLTVPLPQARELAYAQQLDQDRSVTLAGGLPQWFNRLDDTQRTRIKALIHRYLIAMQAAHALLERDLPPRPAFSKKRLDARLRQDFSLKRNAVVTLDLPDSTFWRKTVMAGPAPGTPQKNTLIASPGRSDIALEELAQDNIDQEMWWRLSFLRVKVATDDEQERQAVLAGINATYLRTLVTELDLAGHYETQILQAFFGATSDSAFDKAYRRECLNEPWRLMLKLQGEFAALQGQIDHAGHTVLDIAIDASTPQAYAVEGKRIVLLPAHLTVGGTDTAHQTASTLAGVTFIVEQVSGLTLLYLPDSTDGVFLRQYTTLEEARVDLFKRCVYRSMVDYLAGRALSGDFASHVSRINQAQLRNFNALIGVGFAWPSSTSLSTHLLDVHMGRLLEAHRNSSRSNDALYLEACALKSGALFNYLKMAVGMLPFIGSAVALYDAWNSANLAVAAFLRGDIGHGLAEVESVLLCLIDAAMDVLPGTVSLPAAARLATRQRQRSVPGKAATTLQKTSRQRTRQSLDRFKGYEYEHEISLSDLRPDTHGIYRNVYRHAEGDFIIRQGRIYRIQLSDSPRGWRLYGTWSRGYKMPIALDDTGNWNTHYAVHGTLMDGGGIGGGAVLGHLADGLDPLWPEPVRQWLPRWWTDRQLRRQLTLTNTADAYTRRLETQTRSSNQLLERYHGQAIEQRRPLRTEVDNACINDIDTATAQYQNLAELLPLSHGRKRLQVEDIQSRCAWIVVDRSIQRVTVARDRLLEYLNQIDALVAQSDATALTDTPAHLALVAQRKAVRKKFLKEFDHLHATAEQANLWNGRITNRGQKAKMAPDMTALNQKLGETTHYYLKTAHTLEIITRYDAVEDLSWLYFHVQMKETRIKVGRALLTQHHLPEVQSSLAQRNRVLEDCLEIYAGFRRQLNAWTLGYPQHLDLEQIAPFLEGLSRVEDHARQALKHRPTLKPKETGSKKLFETEDNQLLIGTEIIDVGTQQKRFTIEGIDGFRETWLPRSSGKYHLQVQPAASGPPLPTDVQPLLSEARTRLAAVPAYSAKVNGYARQNMLPVDLEHMFSSEATELNTRAQAIERLKPTDPIVAQLQDKARELRWTGRTLRIDQSIRSNTPTEGYLDYLLQQQVVDIRKEGPVRALGKRADGRKDFLQEYEVRDLSSNPPRTLWYAHFHYTSDKAAFQDFVKAHLKLPEQRNLGLQWQQAQAASGAQVEAIWRGDIGKPFANKLFSAL
ncbi:dermonecrotic toxin domain-containing protein [Pseudomonas sp. NPDC087346]|uniref:dermonecrotic toxin domain-containing protein n=1 Tax=Pseudomonas sp. NPDC087346 TaxID=3364438 RepID=UPI003829E120